VIAPRRRRALAAAAALALAVATPAFGQESPPAPPVGEDLDRRQPPLPRAEPETGLVSISGTLRGAAQWLASAATAQGAVFGAGSLDLNAVVRPSDWARVFVDLEGLAGPGPDRVLGTLSRLNLDADRTEGREMKLVLREAWLRLAFQEGRVRFSIGKLDVTHYFDRNFFAEDETVQFLDTALLNDPMLKSPPNGPGAALRVSVGDWRYALGVHAPDDFDGDLSGMPYVIGELGRRNIVPLRGHYRLWARVGSVPEDRERVTWGTGLSVDQLVTADVGVFVRAGLSRSEGEDLTSRAWSTGVQVTPTWLDRGKDRFGVGYGFQREPAGREEVVETYYTLVLADWLSMTADLQWVVSGPNQVSGRRNRDVVIPGLRAVYQF
jgi:high affinity Mn2+ porin